MTTLAQEPGFPADVFADVLAANVEYLQGVLRRGSRLGNPVVFQNTVPNAAAGYVSVAQGLRGPTATFSSGWR